MLKAARPISRDSADELVFANQLLHFLQLL
jgi:hypothetical protein